MGLDFIRAIQRLSSPALDFIMETMTLFGEQTILAAAFCAVYWCVDKRLGRFLAAAVGTSVCLNGALKDLFKVERLFGSPGIESLRLETATGYSFPSGHTQAAAAFWGGLSIAAKRPSNRVVFAALIFMVGFSRLYLGVHYPADVIAGAVIGLLCAALLYLVMIKRGSWLAVLAVCLSVSVSAIYLGESKDTYKAVGLLAGIVSGLYFEERFIGFATGGIPVSKRLIRYAAGMSLVGVCHFVPKMVLPDALPLDCMRYALTAFVATGFCPYLFKRFRL